ncbi:MAG: ARMT1-like domain-containing protein [Patescibacteria group bacterium]|nr:ARMT1-like domain-containing protein [Patescibacteria group bacterium]
MKTFFDCIPCLIRHSLDSARRLTDDEQVHESLLREVLLEMSRMDLDQPPAAMAQRVHRRIRQLCGNDDLYRKSKDWSNQLALELLPNFRHRMEDAPDRWETAVRLAIAGNIMDLGVKSGLEESEIQVSIAQSMYEPLDGSIPHFVAAIERANRILYLTDNAGEIVFDRLLIEQMPREKVTVAVRGAPIINDATRADAQTAGITELVRVIDNGSDAPGTILAECSDEFRRYFDEADLIIAKGQGNFETLNECTRPIYFLLRVKCAVIARDIGRPIGTMILRPSHVDPASSPAPATASPA